jgi:hypothetical protein
MFRSLSIKIIIIIIIISLSLYNFISLFLGSEAGGCEYCGAFYLQADQYSQHQPYHQAG